MPSANSDRDLPYVGPSLVGEGSLAENIDSLGGRHP
jgi:hypothetical protein